MYLYRLRVTHYFKGRELGSYGSEVGKRLFITHHLVTFNLPIVNINNLKNNTNSFVNEFSPYRLSLLHLKHISGVSETH